jgi:hypothetical protein
MGRRPQPAKKPHLPQNGKRGPISGTGHISIIFEKLRVCSISYRRGFVKKSELVIGGEGTEEGEDERGEAF